MLPIYILREFFAKRALIRTPEPMVMEDESQVEDFYQYGLGDSAMRAVYIFHARWISKTIAKSRHVVDLCCGPANQLSLVAQMNPHIQFTGVDLSAPMLKHAQKNCDNLGITNVKFLQNDVTNLNRISDRSVDGVISTMSLHHLPDEKALELTFKNIRRILAPGGAIYIVDFSLLKSEAIIKYLVSLNKHQPDLFKRDYELSMRAAFDKNIFINLAKKELGPIEIYSTFALNFMIIIKTKSFIETDLSKEFFAKEIQKLGPENRKNFKNLSRLFSLSGLK